jgi:hypothetical protein
MRLDLLLATLGLIIAIVAGALQIFSQDIRAWLLGHVAPSALPAVPANGWIKASLKLVALLGVATCVVGAILALPSDLWKQSTDAPSIVSDTPEPEVTVPPTTTTVSDPRPLKPEPEKSPSATTRIRGADFVEVPAGTATLGCTQGDRD